MPRSHAICNLCQARMVNNGFAKAAHAKVHAREGRAIRLTPKWQKPVWVLVPENPAVEATEKYCGTIIKVNSLEAVLGPSW